MEHSNTTPTKIPILDTGKFEQWQFRIQQYLQHEHYALWEVIEFGDSYEAPDDVVATDSATKGTGKKKGRTITLTTADMQKRKNDSFLENEEEDHALVADEETPTEFALMAKTSLAQVESRLVEFKNQEVKYCEKMKGLEFKVEARANRIESLTNELELLKKEKEGLERKLTGFQAASKDLDSLLESQRSDKNKEGLGYSAIPPSCSSLFSSQEGFVLDRSP
nr:hypothetical protein [Tanacetum cinerariifolium]